MLRGLADLRRSGIEHRRDGYGTNHLACARLSAASQGGQAPGSDSGIRFRRSFGAFHAPSGPSCMEIRLLQESLQPSLRNRRANFLCFGSRLAAWKAKTPLTAHASSNCIVLQVSERRFRLAADVHTTVQVFHEQVSTSCLDGPVHPAEPRLTYPRSMEPSPRACQAVLRASVLAAFSVTDTIDAASRTLTRRKLTSFSLCPA